MDPVAISQTRARRIWLHAQKLDSPAPFGSGPAATPAAVRHLGYVQIDTIHVIERCHHHILFTRIPDYRREHLHQAQSLDKTVFEYWTHALAYLPSEDFRFYVRDMRTYWSRRGVWFTNTKDNDVRRVLTRIRKNGALTIRDIDDDVLVDKDHAWASRKPSKRALQLAFYKGLVTVSQRAGMLKTYELTARHFGWQRPPAAATTQQVSEHLLDRALRSQGVVSLDSITYLNPSGKPSIKRVIDQRVRRKELIPVAVEGAAEKWQHWSRPETLEQPLEGGDLVHILSPFDPLVNQRKRSMLFFNYEHRFEAYVPKPKRVFGYFACPVLLGEEIVAAIDLKTERGKQKLLIQKWTWVGKGSARAHKKKVEAALGEFERFQLAR
jgi:uncharacterized protein YcaQ